VAKGNTGYLPGRFPDQNVVRPPESRRTFVNECATISLGATLMGEKRVGTISRYFHKIGVAAIILEDELKVGSKIRIEGATTNFEMTVHSMQVDRADIDAGSKGQEIAIKVADRVRENDIVFIVD